MKRRPKVSASGLGHCGASNSAVHCIGASLSVAAGMLHRWYAPGGGTDIFARLVGQSLPARLGRR